MEIYDILKEYLEDYNVLSERFGGMLHIWEKYVKNFCNDDTYEKLKRAVNENNTELIEKYAHRLKGEALNLGIVSLGNGFRDIVKYIRENDIKNINEDVIKEKFSKIDDIYTEIFNIYVKNEWIEEK